MTNSELLLEAIFTKCGLVYGRDFLSRWEGIDLAEVKGDWRRELGSHLERPEAIRFALENLPNKAPHVLEFRALCNKWLPPHRPQLEAPVPEDQRLAAAEIKRKAIAALKIMGSRKPREEAA